jgi:hypothetical protein
MKPVVIGRDWHPVTVYPFKQGRSP